MTRIPSRQRIRYAAALALALSVTACGGGAEPPGSSSSSASSSSAATPSSPGGTGTSTPSSVKTPTTPPPPRATPAGKAIAITVKGKQVTPAPRTVDLKVGESLTLVVTSDHDDEIHAHGFEVEGRLKAGAPSRVTVTGRQPGLYEVETHEPPLRLLMIAVR